MNMLGSGQARDLGYLFADGSWVIENFNDIPVTVKLDAAAYELAARGWLPRWK